MRADHLPKLGGICGGTFDVSNTLDHFNFQRLGRSTDSAWPSRNDTLQNRLLWRFTHTRDIIVVFAVTRSPGVSKSYGHASTQPLSAKAGTSLDSLAGRVCHASRGPTPYRSPPRRPGLS